jgi:hypothetical protein
MPTFGGVDIFGTTVQFTTVYDRAEQEQVEASFGFRVPSDLLRGDKATVTRVSGILYGVEQEDLLQAEQGFKHMIDGIARDLIGDRSRISSHAELISFEPQGNVRKTPGGMLFRPYRAFFLHR